MAVSHLQDHIRKYKQMHNTLHVVVPDGEIPDWMEQVPPKEVIGNY